MRTTEFQIMQAIQTTWSKLGGRLFRNNVGTGWVGKTLRPSTRMNVSVCPKDIVIFDCRPLHAGLGEGSSDLIGFKPTLITQEMVGKTLPIFAAIECKSVNGRASQIQKNFINMVNDNGGHGRIAKSVQDSL